MRKKVVFLPKNINTTKPYIPSHQDQGDPDNCIMRKSKMTFTQVLARQSLQFPMQVKVMTEPEMRDYHRKKLYELSIKSLGEIPQIHEPTNDEEEWVLFRLSLSDTWPKVHENKIGDDRNWK
jgi:hypothetical protein